MTSLILCRHGRTDWNDLGRYQGQTDVPLNEEGWEQARQVAMTLQAERIDAVYTSDLRRASDTAQEIARVRGLVACEDPRLREIDQGRWEGLTVEQIRERDADLHARWVAEPLAVTLPEGESIADVRERALAAVGDIIERHAGGSICLVTHKVVMTIVRCELTGEPLEPALRHLPENVSYERVAVPAWFERRRQVGDHVGSEGLWS